MTRGFAAGNGWISRPLKHGYITPRGHVLIDMHDFPGCPAPRDGETIEVRRTSDNRSFRRVISDVMHCADGIYSAKITQPLPMPIAKARENRAVSS